MIHSPAARPPTVLDAEHMMMLHDMLEEQRRFRLEQLAAPPVPMSDAELEVQETILFGARLALTDVEAALARMRTGTYGRCVRCETPLSLERMEIVPHAALCMPCQRRADARKSVRA